MTFENRSGCGIRFLRNWAAICVLLLVIFLLYRDPFLVLWWPQKPAEGTETAVLPLDMAADSIDDMYDGCRSETASMIDLFGVFEWHVNRNFSIAWSLVERIAKKPMHKHLKDDHAIAIYVFTRYEIIQRGFNTALKTGKPKYSTDRFMFHYFYFYLTDAVQALNDNQMCRTTYHRTWKSFDRNIVNTNVRFGAFTWAVSSKLSFASNGNISCFEIHTCFGADITYYSSIRQKGQVLIPTYEVFKVTEVLTNDPWCNVVYKLESTKIPRTDQNCKLYHSLTKPLFEVSLTHWFGGKVLMLACFLLLMINSFILIRRKQSCFVAAVLSALLMVTVVALMLS